jgi:hypothetical protein
VNCELRTQNINQKTNGTQINISTKQNYLEKHQFIFMES